ncbi:hypothetical protein V6N13_072477 [Hibiscus sabdariffa]
MSFSLSEERLTFSALLAPSDCIGIDFGWVAAKKLLSGFNLLQLAPQLENVYWHCLFKTGRWWGWWWSRC